MSTRKSRITRLVVATFLVLPGAVASVTPSLAAPSASDVAAAKARIAQLQDQFAAVNEQYNQALYELGQAQQHLSEAKAMRDAAEKDAADARARLSARAVQAYTDMGSQYEALLSATSMSEFSDRLEFLGAITQTDSSLAAEADVAGQRAAWAAQEYDQAVADAQTKADAVNAQKQQAMQNLQEQQALASQLESQYAEALAAQQAALDAQQNAAPTTPTDPGGSGGGGGFVPPPNASAAAIAVSAAYSAINAPYVFGAAGPDAFDCSGLTSWAWAQAGVYLPHSASAQYSSLPSVPLSEVQPGDIIYYGNFGPHVAIYVGGGTIIHARHPGPGGQVQTSSMYGYDTPYGAVRPG
jgi:cell wall-associated NlpC family hydrolase